MIREIRQFDSIHDAGPVDNPAYKATEAFVSRRALDMARSEPAGEQQPEVPPAPVEPQEAAEPQPAGDEQAPAQEEPAVEGRAAVNMRPTAGMASAARRGLRLHEQGKSGDGLKPETVARANRLAKREMMNEDWIREMNAWFARHESASKSPGWDTPGSEKPGFVAWLLWGGNAAKNWSARKVAEMDGQRDLQAYDEERDVEPGDIGGDVEDFAGKAACLKAAVLRTHLHAK
jgi:hypothetical protein